MWIYTYLYIRICIWKITYRKSPAKMLCDAWTARCIRFSHTPFIFPPQPLSPDHSHPLSILASRRRVHWHHHRIHTYMPNRTIYPFALSFSRSFSPLCIYPPAHSREYATENAHTTNAPRRRVYNASGTPVSTYTLDPYSRSLRTRFFIHILTTTTYIYIYVYVCMRIR